MKKIIKIFASVLILVMCAFPLSACTNLFSMNDNVINYSYIKEYVKNVDYNYSDYDNFTDMQENVSSKFQGGDLEFHKNWQFIKYVFHNEFLKSPLIKENDIYLVDGGDFETDEPQLGNDFRYEIKDYVKVLDDNLYLYSISKSFNKSTNECTKTNIVVSVFQLQVVEEES